MPSTTSASLGVVLVIDASKSMEEDALIERVQEAAHAFVDAKAATDQIAIVSFADTVTVVRGVHHRQGRAQQGDRRHRASSRTRRCTTASCASSALYRDSELQPNLIVFSDGQDSSSKADQATAEAAVTAVGGTLFAVGVENPGFDSLAEIADETGGSAAVADDPAGVGALFEDVQETLRKQYVLTYASEATERRGADRADRRHRHRPRPSSSPAARQEGAAALRPATVEEPGSLRAPAPTSSARPPASCSRWASSRSRC